MFRFLESPVTVYALILIISLTIGALFSKLADAREKTEPQLQNDNAESEEI